VAQAGLWSRYTKPPTPEFLKLGLRFLHKSSICINNGKPTYKTFHRHYVNHQATFLTYNLYLSISLMVTVASIYLRFYIEVGVRVGRFLPTPIPSKIPSDSDSTALRAVPLLRAGGK
jgi:hypothetical protein